MMSLAHKGVKTPQVLIADDDPAIVKYIAGRCANAGFSVQTACNGMQALVKAVQNPPDMLIIDVNMPEVDGLSVCAHVLQSSKKPLDVVVVTGGRDPETKSRCESFGAFYTHKGPEFWANLASALAEVFPEMAGKLREQESELGGSDMLRLPRVLVVDDDPMIGNFLSSRLAKRGVDILYASDAEQGFRIACREMPSVIISDYYMPDGDAHFFLTKLRSTPATENIPLIVLSGCQLDFLTVQSLMREVCGRPGAAAIFRKSVDTEELFGALKKFCGFETNRVES